MAKKVVRYESDPETSKETVYVQEGARSCVQSVKGADDGLPSKNTENIGWGSKKQLKRQKGRVKK